MARYHGLPGVFQPEWVRTDLETISKINMALTSYGAVMFAEPQATIGSKESFDPELDAAYGARSLFVSESILLGCTYAYAGREARGWSWSAT